MKKLITLMLTLAVLLICMSAYAEETVSFVEYTVKNNALEKEMKSAEKTVLDKDAAAWADGKYYVAESDLTISDRVEVSGNVCLVLKDGVTLTAQKGIEVSDGASLTIYGQEKGTGKLTATGETCAAGIGGGGREVAGGTVKIYGGSVRATGGQYGSGIGSGQMGTSADLQIYGGDITAIGNIKSDNVYPAVGCGNNDGSTRTVSVKMAPASGSQIVVKLADTEEGLASAKGASYAYTADGHQIGDSLKPKENWKYVFSSKEIKLPVVTFDGNGGEGGMDAQVFEPGKAQALRANAFTRTGYKFVFWMTEEEAYDDGQSASFNADTTLVAQWEPISYTVAYDANGGEGEMEPHAIRYNETQRLKKNAFTKPGYRFAGWKIEGVDRIFADEEPVQNLTAENGATVTLIAQWDVIDNVVEKRVEQTGDFASMSEEEKRALEEALFEDMPKDRDTVDEIDRVMRVIAEESTLPGWKPQSGAVKTETRDVRLQYSLDGKTWIDATVENFPKEGITVELPIPEGASEQTHDFLIIRMFTKAGATPGKHAGDVEKIIPRIIDGKLVATLKGLSPVAVAWQEKQSDEGGGAEGEVVQETVNDLPKTGDGSMLGMWVELLGASAAGLKIRRRR